MNFQHIRVCFLVDYFALLICFSILKPIACGQKDSIFIISQYLSVKPFPSYFFSFLWVLTLLGPLFLHTHTHTHTHILTQNLNYSVTQSCSILWNPMNCSTPGFPVFRYLLEFTQTHVCWIGNAVEQSHPLLSPFTLALKLFQHQGLFQWVGSSYQVAEVLELHHQHQSFQWIFTVDVL